MKKMSKTLLSMALAIAMVLSLMPMSFAEGETALDKSGVYVEYDIISRYAASTSIATILTYDTTNGFFGFEATSAGSVWYHNATSRCVQLTKDNWLIFKINVPVAGKYDIKIKNYLGGKGGTLNAYIFPTDVTPDLNAISEDNYIGSVNCSSSSGGNNGATSGTPNPFVKDGVNASYTFTTAGEYYIGFKAVGNNGYVGDIVLDGGTGYALIGDMTIEPESVGVGENAQATATAYKSNDGTQATLTYACTDAGVTVNPATGEISIASDCEPGKKTITATAEGAANSLSRELEVTAAKSGVTVQYDIMSHKENGSGSLYQRLSYEKTNGFFTYAAANASGLTYHNTSTCIDLGAGQWIIFKINVPVAGKYDVKIKNHLGNKGENLYAYIFPDTVTPNADALSGDNYIGYVDCSKSDPDANNGAETGTPNPLKDKAGNPVSYTFPAAGEYYIGFTVTAEGKKGFVGNIVLDGGSGNVLMPYFDGNTTLRTGETATLSGFLSSTGAAASVTYESSNSDVAKVENGTITAVAPGKATVTMTATDSTVVAGSPYTVEIAVPDADLQEAFDAEPEQVDDYVAPTVTGIVIGESVITPVSNGDGSYNLTAPEKKGEKEFLYWAKGMETKKRIVSFSETLENYVPDESGKTYLIAVYEGDIEDTTTPEYYNINGQLIAKRDAEPDYPSIPGLGTAYDWEPCGGNIFVAKYADKELDKVKVTVDGIEDTVYYGTLITCTANADNFKCWKKTVGNITEIVSVDSTYTFRAWENCIVTAVYEEHIPVATAMKIIIDDFDIDGDTGVMAEFIGITNAVEKGIMFTDATSKETRKIAMTTTDNQFTVVADKPGTYVGYAILKSGNAYSIITDGSYEK